MAGGGDTPELAAAVSEAGGLGFIGGAYLSPEQIGVVGEAVRARTNRSFGFNLFAPLPPPETPPDLNRAVAAVRGYYAELGLPAPAEPALPPDRFDLQLQAAVASGAQVFSFTFGLLTPEAVEAVKRRGLLLIGTASTVAEAVALEQSGVDAIVAQGAEAGGHRATFSGDFAAGLVGTMALVPLVADAVSVPVIASGGIMDGRGIAAALALGAEAVQLGTAFLTCDEAGVPESYKQAILEAREDSTRVTRAFSGRPARGVINRFMREVEAELGDAIPPFPLQNTLTQPLRAAARKADRAEFLSLWAGQGAPMAKRQSAAALVGRLGAETDAALARLR
jgi:nitronate monooxygenase